MNKYIYKIANETDYNRFIYIQMDKKLSNYFRQKYGKRVIMVDELNGDEYKKIKGIVENSVLKSQYSIFYPVFLELLNIDCPGSPFQCSRAKFSMCPFDCPIRNPH